jgi:hypothetical protein
MKVNIGYAWGQLLRAQQSAAEAAEGKARARAEERVAKWKSVIAGMQAGTIDVGSRTPTKAPAWVTLDVVTGGFATGGYTAGGPLRDDERALAVRVGVPASRAALNIHYATSDEAGELLASGRYRIDVPEQGALLVAAWLCQRGEIDRATALVEKLAPWFERLRFYPAPAEHAVELSELVRLQDIDVTVKALDTGRRQVRFETMRDALLVWKPLRERAIALFAETIDAHGCPGMTFPDGWRARVAALVADTNRAGVPTTNRGREARALVADLVRCADDPSSITRRERGAIRRTIERHVAAHGMPGTAAHEARRRDDARAVAGPVHADLRSVLVERLRAVTGGVDLSRALAAVTESEAAKFGVPAGTAMPAYFEPKVTRSWDAPLGELVDRRIIGSGEVLARVLPQVTGHVRAQALDDADARRLYVSLYQAFRRRRGLLLVNYQHQVRFHELPWVAALEQARASHADASARARKALAATSSIALRAFPHTIIPNKLVTELSALTSAAELRLPLVEELAADIFMGSFTAKFVEATKVSARLLAGTLYARYYAIDVDEVARMRVPEKTSPELAALCARRAGLHAKMIPSVPRNGKVIEQAQILTTHNLGVLFDALPLRDQLAAHLRPIAETCFSWSVRRLRARSDDWHQGLIDLKNAAYAWRQMVFYLSFVADLPAFLDWARTQLERDLAFRTRFEPAMRGLELAASGVASDDPTFAAHGARVFTGWSTERHWLAA